MAHSSSAMRRFNHLVSETDAVYHEVSARLGLSDSVMQILYILYDFPDGRCALQEICRWSGTSKQTINSALRRLEAEGVLYLEQAGGKRKTVCLPPEALETYLTLTERYLAAFREEAGERIP